LREKYKAQKKAKPKTSTEDTPYFARVEYSTSTFKGSRKYFIEYAIIHKCWAYTMDNHHKKIIKKKIAGSNFSISERYSSRPEGMDEEVANSILSMINK